MSESKDKLSSGSYTTIKVKTYDKGCREAIRRDKIRLEILEREKEEVKLNFIDSLFKKTENNKSFNYLTKEIQLCLDNIRSNENMLFYLTLVGEETVSINFDVVRYISQYIKITE